MIVFFFVTVYTPNSQSELARVFLTGWSGKMHSFPIERDWNKTKPVIFCGDLNVAHQEIDPQKSEDQP